MTMPENPNPIEPIEPVTKLSRCRVAPVAYLFDKKGLIQISPTGATGATGAGRTFDDLFDLAVEAGAEDVREIESDQEVLWEVSEV
jgi:transcriptional/translational regulatory protein YebC/TACO1